tara:strand:- start:2017 stop:2286 length:270 start_codon:yes stop_codon:yes gene_type:complete
MSYKSQIISKVLIVVGAAISFAVFIPKANLHGQDKARFEILERCQNHQVVTINDIEIHCGIIHPAVNIEAAKYRGLKRCVKSIKEFTNE